MQPWAALIGVLALIASVAGGWYARGQWDEGRAAVVQVEQKDQQVAQVQQQGHDTVQAEVRYVDRIKVIERRLPAFSVDFMSRCLYNGSAGIASVPGPHADTGSDGTGADAAARRWCEAVASNYAAGQRNTEKLILARDAIVASGGGKH